MPPASFPSIASELAARPQDEFLDVARDVVAATDLTQLLVDADESLTAAGERLLAVAADHVDQRPVALTLRAWLLVIAASLDELTGRPSPDPVREHEARAALAAEYRDPLLLRRDGFERLLDDVL